MLHCQVIPVTVFAQNCTLLWDDETREAIFIDAGGDSKKLQGVLDEMQLKLVALWNTHGHLDHIGAVGALAAHYQVPVIGPHLEDQFWIEGLQEACRSYGFPIAEPVEVTQWLKGGERLVFGNYEFEVRHTPGHTPGHVIFYCQHLNMLWTGDVLFKGSIGRTDFPRGDFQTLMQSIREQLFSLPDDTQFICGHGPTSTIGHEKKYNPFVSGRAG